MKIRDVALIIFYDKEKRILLQNRKGISKVGEEWGFFGGHIEKEETPEKALTREVKEELKEKADEVIKAFEKDLGIKKEKASKKVEES